MKIKKIAAFAAACVVLLFGVWACSEYKGREVTPNRHRLSNQQLTAQDSVAELASNSLFVAYFNALNFQYLQIRSITENMTYTQVDAYYQELDSIGQIYLADTSNSTNKLALLQKMGYSSITAYYNTRNNFIVAQTNLMNNCSLLSGMSTEQKEILIEAAINYYIIDSNFNDGRGKGGIFGSNTSDFTACLNKVIAGYNKCMKLSHYHELVAYYCELESWIGEDRCCCLHRESCCSSAD